MKSARALAADAGEHIYHNGEACPKGHNDGRYTRTARCVRCSKDDASRRRRDFASRIDAAKASAA
jgi:hypothetical protein